MAITTNSSVGVKGQDSETEPRLSPRWIPVAVPMIGVRAEKLMRICFSRSSCFRAAPSTRSRLGQGFAEGRPDLGGQHFEREVGY